MVTRFASEKGVEVLLDALPTILKKYPKAQVLYAGQHENVMGEQAYFDRLCPADPRIRNTRVIGHSSAISTPFNCQRSIPTWM